MYAGGYQSVPSFISPGGQGASIRHPHYQAPGPNYNAMSPTNQGVYGYGPPSMGPYSMQNYGHMMTSMANTEQGAPEQSGQGRDPIAAPTGPGMVMTRYSNYKNENSTSLYYYCL